jgi:hypothetical protein
LSWRALQDQLSVSRHNFAAFFFFMAECMHKFGEKAQEEARQAANEGLPAPRRPFRALDLPRISDFLKEDFAKVRERNCCIHFM